MGFCGSVQNTLRIVGQISNYDAQEKGESSEGFTSKRSQYNNFRLSNGVLIKVVYDFFEN